MDKWQCAMRSIGDLLVQDVVLRKLYCSLNLTSNTTFADPDGSVLKRNDRNV